jgi:hypothetical protein
MRQHRSHRFGRGLVLFAMTAGLSASAPAAGLTVVELFTSQGCSSCPPANANLAALAGSRDDVVPLSFGVTYWDKLGWKDSFASPVFTQRQRDYATALRRDGYGTPQMVINGRTSLIGNDRSQLDTAIAGAGPLVGPTIATTANDLSIGAGPRRTAPADIWLVRYDPRTIAVPIRAGENEGRTLPHRNVVRSLTRLGGWSGDAERIALPRPTAGLRSVILVQTARLGPILAAARLDPAGR